MKTEKFWRIASKKLTFLGKNKLAQKLKRLKKTGMCFYYFYIISPYSKNTMVNFEAFRWNIPSSINLFFLENMSQKVEMV